MFTIFKLIGSSLKMFVRNRQALFFTMFFPVILMTLLGLLAFDNFPKIDVGVVVTAPPTSGTQKFVDQLKQIPAFDVTVGTERSEKEAIEKGDRSSVLIIPGDFFPEGAPTSPDPKKLVLLKDANNLQQASTVQSIISQILDKTTLSITNAPTLFTLESREINSQNFKYIDFLVPGIVSLSIMQMAVFSVAFVFVDYKEKGVLKRLLATPMKPYQFVTANVVTRLLVSVVQAGLLIAIGVIVFKAHLVGSPFVLLPVVLLGAIMFLGLGFTISGFANTIETVPAIANLVVFPMMFLGGAFFAIDSMPDWLQSIANYLPLTFLSTAVRSVMLDGASLSDIQHNLLWMGIWAVILITTANFTFGLEEKRQ
ncbi:MAG: ABC transporter permease [Candidatus Doudnabacteria bacterium]|nr:ABC transporter permease [Candidatus Doudnabacteria bacterium]